MIEELSKFLSLYHLIALHKPQCSNHTQRMKKMLIIILYALSSAIAVGLEIYFERAMIKVAMDMRELVRENQTEVLAEIKALRA